MFNKRGYEKEDARQNARETIIEAAQQKQINRQEKTMEKVMR